MNNTPNEDFLFAFICILLGLYGGFQLLYSQWVMQTYVERYTEEVELFITHCRIATDLTDTDIIDLFREMSLRDLKSANRSLNKCITPTELTQWKKNKKLIDG